MKRLTIDKLIIKNFKGIKSQVIDFESNDTQLLGVNGSGKTTVFDAFTWLLFNKDSNDKTDFAIKTLDADNNVLHNLEHSVEGHFTLDGKPLQIKKILEEKWVKPRGESQKRLDGHTTFYYVDEVPAKKKEYDAFIDELIDEEVFKRITSPTYFNELHWVERRKELLSLAGDVSDADVIASNEQLTPLQEAVEKRSIDDHKKVLLGRKKDLNKDLEHIPTRIDELSMTLSSVEDTSAAEAELKSIDEQVEALREQIAAIKNGQAVSVLKNELQQLENQLQQLTNELTREKYEESAKLASQLQMLTSDKMNIERMITTAQSDIERNEITIKRRKESQDGLRNEYHSVNDTKFVHNDSCVCPTCDQELPADRVEAARQNALEQFNLNKSKQLEQINEQGVRFKREIEELEAANEQLAKNAQKAQGELSVVTKNIDTTTRQKGDVDEAVQQIQADERLDVLKSQIEVAKQKIVGAQSNVTDEVATLEQSVQQLIAGKAEHEMVIAKKRANEATTIRIAELEAEQTKLAGQLDDVDHELYLIEQFVTTKVDMLTDKINSFFKITKWKLFETQVNGGIKETCVATYNGVPYDAGLNTGHRIRVGIDIVNTLSKHYAFSAPVFIDNAEAVTGVLECDSQMIELYVDPKVKTLQVHTLDEKLSA